MGVTAHEQSPSLRVHDVGLVQNDVATALRVAIDDGRAGSHPTPDPDGREETPILLEVEIPEEVLQVPLADELVTLGVVEERRRPLGL